MTNFIKSALAELEHVVWPTHLETKKLFTITVSIIVGMTIFTYLLTLIFSNTLFSLRGIIHTPANVDLSGSPVIENVGVTTTDGTPVEITPVESTEVPVTE